jgi:nitrogen fixation protein FixH
MLEGRLSTTGLVTTGLAWGDPQSLIAGLGRRMAPYWGVLALFVVLFFGTDVRAGEWRAVEVRGSVTVQEPSMGLQQLSRSLKAGESISAGALISTGADGRAVLSDGRDAINVFSHSRIRLPVSASGAETSFFQYLGRVRYKAGARKQGSLSVDSPLLAAVVKGTVFVVEVGPGGDRVHVSEGSVAVASKIDARSVLLNRGQAFMVASEQNKETQALRTDDAAAANPTGSARAGSTESGQEPSVPSLDPTLGVRAEQSAHKIELDVSKISVALVVAVLTFSVVVAFSIVRIWDRRRAARKKVRPRWQAYSEISGDSSGRDVTLIVTDEAGAPVSGLRFVASLKQVRAPAKSVNVTLTPSRPGVYTATLGRLESGHWQLEGRAYRGGDTFVFSRRHSLL